MPNHMIQLEFRFAETVHRRSQRLPVQFSPLSVEVDEQALAALWEKGRKAWKEVPSATDWVESLRGNRRISRLNLPPAPPSQRVLVLFQGCWPEGYEPMSGEQFQPLVGTKERALAQASTAP